MTTGSLVRLCFVGGIAFAALLIGCGGDKKSSAGDIDTTAGLVNDSVRIQMVLNETVARWKERDVAVLYDQEFEYFQDKISYDEYVDQELIRRLEADSLVSLTADTVVLFGRDSARVSVDAFLRGRNGDEYHYPDVFTMYFHRGRWIRPTMALPEQQRQYDSLKRAADSAAEAENEEEAGA